MVTPSDYREERYFYLSELRYLRAKLRIGSIPLPNYRREQRLLRLKLRDLRTARAPRAKTPSRRAPVCAKIDGPQQPEDRK